MTFKSWQYSLVLPFFIFIGLTGCSNDSEKTDPTPPNKAIDKESNSNKEGWSKKDRLSAIKEIEQVREELELKLGDKTDAFIECYLSKIEEAYPNLAALENDNRKAAKISKECAEDLMKIEE